MFRTVVVGADDSPTAAVAVEAAIDLVEQSQGTLHVVSAYTPVSPLSSDVPDEFRDAVRPDSLVRSVLDTITARARLRGVSVEAHDRRGAPADAVKEVADQVAADLVVVGSKGMNRRVLSSIPNSVAHQASCAVLIVKTD
jgi:nucleotide-binding universal stress UspA family protein